MNFEGGMILLLGVIFGFPLVMGLLYLLNWIAGRTLIPLWIPLVLLVVVPIAGSFYLDTAGEVHTVKVLTKNETIKYGRQFHHGGSWTRQLSVQVEHPWEDTSLTPYLSLSADAATFDALQVGKTTKVRVMEAGRLFKFGRFANRSTLSMIMGLFPPEPRGPWHEATATIEQISNFTEYVQRSSSSHTPLRWPYQFVRLSFTPPGRTEPVEIMDSIEIGSVSGIVEKAVVPITWPEDDPRSARIIGGRPGRAWANWFYMMGEELAVAVVILALILLFGIWSRRRKAKKMGGPISPA